MPSSKNSPRRAGVLLHISSLPGPGPIGVMGAEARRFVDFLRESGQTVWQVLPLTPPASCNSPYSAHSVFAGNPYLIDLAELEERSLLPGGSVAALPKSPRNKVDYGVCERYILPLLREAFAVGWEREGEQVADFRRRHAYWLEDYALYMAIHTQLGDIPYLEWPPLLGKREPGELTRTKRRLAAQIDFWIYVQYLFFTQWLALKEYANSRGVRILGDMPFYTAEGSADVWAHYEVFQLDENRRPQFVAGVPPDGFTDEGQRWGNPLYDWEYLSSTRYRWWTERLKVACLLYDEVRIDHFRALDEYYAIPTTCKTAKEGAWRKGPGMEFFSAIEKALPGCRLVAEDLGVVTDGLRGLLKDSRLPGMKVLLFAFTPWAQSDYLPHNHKRKCVAYIGTHDNDTALGWMRDGKADETRFATEYLRLTPEEGYHWGFIRGLYGSVADTAIVQMQDFLGLDNTARMNIPGTVGGNWEWRMEPEALTGQLAVEVGAMVARYGRWGQ